jgi:hypothetical protein
VLDIVVRVQRIISIILVLIRASKRTAKKKENRFYHGTSTVQRKGVIGNI